LAGFDTAAVLGIYSGAVTNTPSLGAGSQTLSTLPNTPDHVDNAFSAMTRRQENNGWFSIDPKPRRTIQ
jgi:uncharacterized transporter YbjL